MISGLLALLAALSGWDAGAEAAALERHGAPLEHPDTAGIPARPDTSPALSAVAVAAPPKQPQVGPVWSATAPRVVRVVLREGAPQMEVRLVGAFSAGGQSVGDRTVQLKPRDLSASGLPLESDGTILLVPSSETSSFSLGKRTYRGSLRLRRHDGALAAVNELDLEDYLMGVVPGEIGRRLDPRLLEAVKAQAVVARTYAIRGIGQYGASKPWDLRDDVRDQVYEGRGGEDPLCTRAVKETRGRVLLDRQGRPVDSYYHSTSGGSTADVAAVWPGKTVRPYLRGIDDTAPDGRAWGAWSPSAAWTETWAEGVAHEAVRANLREAMGKPCDPGPVNSLTVSGHDPSGRVRKLVVTGRKGACEVVGDRVRWALKRPGGAGILRSARFSLERSGGRYIARGTGNGHGVGMSQTGALGRARSGQKHDFILQTYYPGTILADTWTPDGSTKP